LTFSLALLADRGGDAAASERLAHQAAALAERCGAGRWAAIANGQLAWLHISRQDCKRTRVVVPAVDFRLLVVVAV